MKKTTVLLIVLCMGISLNAQFSSYLEKGKSGLGINVIGETSGYMREFRGLGAEAGYSFKGKLDLNAMYIADSYDEAALELLSDKASSGYYEASVTYWMLRDQVNPEIAFNLGLFSGIAGSIYKDYLYFDDEDADIAELQSWMDGFLGAAASMNFKLNSSWYVQPSLKVRYEIGNSKAFDNDIVKTTYSNGVTQDIGLYLFNRMNNGNTFLVGTNIYSDTYSGGNYYQLSVGYVFGL